MMWKILRPGDTVQIDGRTCAVRGLQEGRVAVELQPQNTSPQDQSPSTGFVDVGDEVELRCEQEVRKARVVAVEDSLAILGPSRMRDSREDADCPYCWLRDVPGEDTGVGFGFSGVSGRSRLPDPIAVRSHKCPGCGVEWSSMEWPRLAERTP